MLNFVAHTDSSYSTYTFTIQADSWQLDHCSKCSNKRHSFFFSSGSRLERGMEVEEEDMDTIDMVKT